MQNALYGLKKWVKQCLNYKGGEFGMAEFVRQTEKPSFDDLMKKYKKQHRDIATSLKLHEYYMTPAEKKVLKRKEALKRK